MKTKIELSIAISLALDPKHFKYLDTDLKRTIYIVHGGRVLHDLSKGNCDESTLRDVRQTIKLCNNDLYHIDYLIGELHYQETFKEEMDEIYLLENDDYDQAYKRIEILELLSN